MGTELSRAAQEKVCFQRLHRNTFSVYGTVRGVHGVSAVRTVTAAAHHATRARSPVRDLSSSFPPPPGFDVSAPATWPSKVPKGWCRACWASARQKRFNMKHDFGSEGRRCRLEPEGDSRPDSLFGILWRSEALSGGGYAATDTGNAEAVVVTVGEGDCDSQA